MNNVVYGLHRFSLIASSEQSIDFYTNFWVQEKRRMKRDYDTVVIMKGYGIGLEIFIDSKHPKRGVPEPQGLRLISLRVDGVKDVMDKMGTKIGEVQVDLDGNKYVMVEDPDGNVVQLCE